MLRKAGLLGIAVLALASGPANAAPEGKGLITESWDCGAFGDPVTIVHSPGNSGWIGQDHYVLTSFAVSDSEGSSSQTYGAKKGFGDPITCTLVDDGTTIVATAAQVP